MLNGQASVILRCRLSRSAFSSERIFEVNLANGGEHLAAADVQYCMDEQFKRLLPDQPADRKVTIRGYVDAQVIHKKPDGNYLVSVPSGDVLVIAPSEMKVPQQGPITYVPVES